MFPTGLSRDMIRSINSGALNPRRVDGAAVDDRRLGALQRFDVEIDNMSAKGAENIANGLLPNGAIPKPANDDNMQADDADDMLQDDDDDDAGPIPKPQPKPAPGRGAPRSQAGARGLGVHGLAAEAAGEVVGVVVVVVVRLNVNIFHALVAVVVFVE